jgi:hypothetical protein
LINEIASGQGFEDWFGKSISLKSKVVRIDSGTLIYGWDTGRWKREGGHEIEYIR